MELTRECVRTNEHFNPSDGLDFYHAVQVVSISYCTHVVLDKKLPSKDGAARSNRSPSRQPQFSDGTQMDELYAWPFFAKIPKPIGIE